VLRRRAARPSRWRALRVARSDVRRALLHRSAWPGIVLSSTVVVAAHSTTFVVAAAAVGTPAPLQALVPLALLNLVAMSVPAGIAGWGPREGAAAWSFAASGLGAAQGVAVATAYGLLSAAAVLPGLAVLVAGAVRRRGSGVPVPDGARA
jgi:glycosyltransferase 2 family protein